MERLTPDECGMPPTPLRDCLLPGRSAELSFYDPSAFICLSLILFKPLALYAQADGHGEVSTGDARDMYLCTAQM